MSQGFDFRDGFVPSTMHFVESIHTLLLRLPVCLSLPSIDRLCIHPSR